MICTNMCAVGDDAVAHVHGHSAERLGTVSSRGLVRLGLRCWCLVAVAVCALFAPTPAIAQPREGATATSASKGAPALRCRSEVRNFSDRRLRRLRTDETWHRFRGGSNGTARGSHRPRARARLGNRRRLGRRQCGRSTHHDLRFAAALHPALDRPRQRQPGLGGGTLQPRRKRLCRHWARLRTDQGTAGWPLCTHSGGRRDEDAKLHSSTSDCSTTPVYGHTVALGLSITALQY